MKYAKLSDQNLDEVMAGVGMLMAQSVIVSNQFFDEKEIRKYLNLRRSYHDTFVKACESLAKDLEQEDPDLQIPASTMTLLLQVAELPPTQAQRALRLAVRALRGLKRVVQSSRVETKLRRIVFLANQLAVSAEDDSSLRSTSIEFITALVRLSTVPAPVRTLLRKAIKYANYVTFSETANAGAWFEMPPERKNAIRVAMRSLLEEQTNVYKVYEDPEKRREAYKRVQYKIDRLRNVAGVNVEIIGKTSEEPPLEDVLKKESKLQVDGPTEFVQLELTRTFRENFEKDGKLPREYGKLLTQLNKARTLATAKRVIEEAKDRKLVHDDTVKTVEEIWGKISKNLAVQKGAKLTPLQWTPVSEEKFQEKHSTGRVYFDETAAPAQREETRGRVSRALEDLEGIFGKGFCGKHGKALEFDFRGTRNGATANYFAWADPNNWQPKVTFGDDYPGYLAHELSHFFDDLLGSKVDQLQNPEGFEKLRQKHGPGSSDLFGRTGVDLEWWVSNSRATHPIPEVREFAEAVVNTPDFKRWKDMIGNLHHDWIGKAVENLTGKRPYELDTSHPYSAIYRDVPQFKSEWPPELLVETERVYREKGQGDSRKLNYYNSGPEVWARMVEQYVATKLADAGISNPWLTQLSYDVEDLPQMMDQKRFEQLIVPILDRLFRTIKDRQLVASKRVVRRFLRFFETSG